MQISHPFIEFDEFIENRKGSELIMGICVFLRHATYLTKMNLCPKIGLVIGKQQEAVIVILCLASTYQKLCLVVQTVGQFGAKWLFDFGARQMFWQTCSSTITCPLRVAAQNFRKILLVFSIFQRHLNAES